ncbi:LysR family transcriptional regulator [Pelistega ratti]|uniref:LysR family transcriptional regulator n=1 Tax=Pelistega ratti TaxID=2652177 RepID=UPI0013580C22|nr:LysR family transcriptional regulator [Pelistega ratti]
MQEIKPLLVFAHLLQQGTMQATADILGITPSAVSQHISRLEQQYQVKLINRSTRRLVPTEVGRVLGEYCHKLLQDVNDTFAALENAKTEAQGDIHIALASGLANNRAFIATLQQLIEQYPAIQPHLHFSDDLQDLQQGKIDIAIRGGKHALDDPNIVAHHLISTQWQILATTDYLAKYPIKTPTDLLTQTWLAYQPIHFLMQKGKDNFVLHIEHPIYCSQLLAQQKLLQQGIGLGLVLETDFQQERMRQEIHVVLPEWRIMGGVELYAVTPHRVQSAKVSVVLNLLKENFAHYY